MEAILAFVAALLALRLAGGLASRYRVRRITALAVWAAALLCYALAAAALAWGAAAGWDDRTFRVYYLFGGLLTAMLLGAGALLLQGQRWVLPLTFVYVGLAIGIAISVPLAAPVSGNSIPEAQAHLAFAPARLVAVFGNVIGTVAVIGVAVATFRRRPLGNTLIVAGVIMAAAGSAVAGLGSVESAVFIMVAAALLYLGFLSSIAVLGRPALHAGKWPLAQRYRSSDSAASRRRSAETSPSHDMSSSPRS